MRIYVCMAWGLAMNLLDRPENPELPYIFMYLWAFWAWFALKSRQNNPVLLEKPNEKKKN